MTLAPQSTSTLFAGTSDAAQSHIYLTTDAGNSWSAVYSPTDGAKFNDMQVDPLSSPSALIVYAATTKGVLKSIDGGTTWGPKNSTLGDLSVQSVKPDPNTANLVYIGTSAKFYYSTDGGTTWLDAGADPVTAGGVSIFNDDIYLGNGLTSAIQCSKLAAGSSTWQVLAAQSAGGFQAKDLAIDPTSSSYLYASGNIPASSSLRVIECSSNSGNSWNAPVQQPVGNNQVFFNAITVDPNSPARIFSVAQFNRFGAYSPEFQMSTDHGATWTYPPGYPTSADYYTIAIDKNSGSPGNPSQVLYGAGGLYLVSPGVYVYGKIVVKSTDGGQHWFSLVDDISNTHITSMVLDPQVSSTFYLAFTGEDQATSGGILKTTDGGVNFYPVTMPATGTMHHVVSLAHDPIHSNVLFMAEEANAGLWKVSMTVDGGVTWTVLSTGLLANVKINHLVFKSNVGAGSCPAYLYAATDNGVYRNSLNILLNYTTYANWNMMAVPDVVCDFAKSAVWPGAASTASRWDAACQCYVETSTLKNSEGYWIKWNNATAVSYTGWPMYNDAMQVGPGWNLIGSISNSVPTSAIVQNPPGNVISQYFSYGPGGYFTITNVTPGLGVWVKVTAAGTLTFPSSSPKVASPQEFYAVLDKFTISDATGFRQSMFAQAAPPTLSKVDADTITEWPPDPPEGVLSAHFKSGAYVQKVHSTTDYSKIPIVVRSAVFPVTLSWDIKPGSELAYRIRVGNAEHGDYRNIAGRGELLLDRAQGGIIPLEAQVGGLSTPDEYVLSQNYPNPFNPTTSIGYSLKESGHVTVKVFDVLGQEVSTLVNGYQSAGYKQVIFNANELPSGVYFYRLQARQIDGGQAGNFTAVKKMILAK